MTETVVHVTTLEQWKSVLDVWFEQGYKWNTGDTVYAERLFSTNEYLILIDYIYCDCNEPDTFIEYSEFMAQQKENNKIATVYEVSQSVFDLLKSVKAHEGTSLIGSIACNAHLIKSIEVGKKAILRYLADDPAIEFKVKEQLYRLWATDQYGDKVYFGKNHGFWTSPATQIPEDIFTAPLEKIKKWQTPDWEIEKVEE